MQDPNLVNRPLEHSSPDGRVERPVEDRVDGSGPAVVSNKSSGTGGWAVAVILAVLVAVGIFYFVGTGSTDNEATPNANAPVTSDESAPATGTTTQENAPAVGTTTQDSAPAGGTTTPESAPADSATTTTP